jgi:hypothetical protein
MNDSGTSARRRTSTRAVVQELSTFCSVVTGKRTLTSCFSRSLVPIRLPSSTRMHRGCCTQLLYPCARFPAVVTARPSVWDSERSRLPRGVTCGLGWRRVTGRDRSLPRLMARNGHDAVSFCSSPVACRAWLGLNLSPSLIFRFVLLSYHCIRLCPSVVANTCHLPRDSHIRCSPRNLKPILRYLLCDVEIGRGTAD